jgi:hypothetical protein
MPHLTAMITRYSANEPRVSRVFCGAAHAACIFLGCIRYGGAWPPRHGGRPCARPARAAAKGQEQRSMTPAFLVDGASKPGGGGG